MPFAAAISEHPLATHAVGEVVGEVLEQIGEAPDAAVVFVSGAFAGAMEDIAGAVRSMLRPGSLIGTTASAVIGGGREVEHGPAISLFAMRFGPRRRFGSSGLTRAVGFAVERQAEGWQVTATDDVAQRGATLVLLADPFSFPVDAFVADITSRATGLTVVGGLASAASGPGGNRFVADEIVADHGAVGLLLPPGIPARAVVSQGCRPVGLPLVVTRASGTLIEEIAGQPALDRLMGQADDASPEDRSQMARSLLVGLVTDERKAEFGPGDFLIRDVLGADHQRGAVAVGAEVEVGTTIQFQVRDASSADDELRQLLAETEGSAALVFSCNGRGRNLFDEPDHDAAVVHAHVDGGPTAGMFCAGEIGPVGDQHFLHAMTASVLLLDDAV